MPILTEEERATILENLLHDLAALDATTEEEALAVSERLVAEGRIDPAKTAEAHRRLLLRLCRREAGGQAQGGASLIRP